MANHVSTTTSLIGIPLNLKHSIFVAKVVNMSAYSCNTWVLNAGPTDHIICSFSLLTTITSLTQCVVELPNRENAQVTHIGLVRVFATLVLENVLCAPSFSFNLLSISKLTQPYCLVFLFQFYFIQDLLPWKMIVIGEVHNGLYLLQRSDCINPSSLTDYFIKHKSTHPSSFSINFVISLPKVWHFRLGHPSINKFKSLQDTVLISILVLMFVTSIHWQNKKDCISHLIIIFVLHLLILCIFIFGGLILFQRMNVLGCVSWGEKKKDGK